ncbi:MAG: hypothetical protein ACO1RX_02450 [Candidatus Sericytochromatia bacterium]
MGDIKIGTHDTGFWDKENPVRANAKPAASGLDAEAALTAAKGSKGAELVVIGADGKTAVHSLSIEDSLISENKQIRVQDLDRDPAQKQDLGKTPLAIDDCVASAFKGQAAFLVDEQNKVAYLGDDVDQTTPQTMLKDAEKFLAQPTRDKVSAAYQIATAAGQPTHVDKTVARQGLDQLQQDYRQSSGVAQNVSLLKPGAVRTQMEGLIGGLNTLAGQESERVSALQTELDTRTGKFQNDIKEPARKLDAAKQAWAQASQQEARAVTQSAYNLREARLPNVHQLESNLEEARGHSSRSRQQLDQAIENRVQAQGRVTELERLPGEAENHLQEARRLESDNRGMHRQIQSYVSLTLSQVSSERRSVSRDLDRANSELSSERNKPARPSGSGGAHTTDPFASKPSGGSHTTDPFASKPSGGSHTTDPFASKPSGGGHTTDPFAGDHTRYRDDGRVYELERQVSRLRSEHDDLRSRESSLDSLNTRLVFTQDVDQISLLFYDLSSIDRMALSSYKDRHDTNKRGIAQQQRAAQDKRNQYEREIGGARNSLSRATSNEENARGAFAQAEGRVGQLNSQLQDLKANPRPDDHAAVKPVLQAHERALAHQQATVGEQAPLTRTRDQAQGVVDSINRSYAGDRKVIEDKIANVQQTLRQDALGQINQTRQQIR